MRIVRFSGRVRGMYAWGCLPRGSAEVGRLLGKVSAQGRYVCSRVCMCVCVCVCVCVCPGGVHHPAPEADTPPAHCMLGYTLPPP